MEIGTALYHYQADIDPYARLDSWNMYVNTANMKDIMDAYNEYISDKEEN